MGEIEPHWSKRRKGRKRRIAFELRVYAPLVAIALCLAGSATAILAVERAEADDGVILDVPYLTMSSSSTSKLSAAPPGMPGRP